MRVCIVTTAFPRHSHDDRGVFVLEAARAIQANGCKVRVLSMYNPESLHHEVIDDIEVFRPQYIWPKKLAILQKAGGGLPEVWRTNAFSRLAIWPFLLTHTISSAVFGKNSDIIHANWTLSATTVWLSRFYHQKPWLATVQGSDVFQAAKTPFVREISRLSLNQSQRVFALSRALANATEKIGVTKDKIKIMPNGVNCNKFVPLEHKKKESFFLFVGSLIKRKGVNFLIEAWSKAKISDYKLVVIGEGPEEQSLKKQAYDLGVDNTVFWLGAQKPSEVSDWMRRAYAFVLPSIEEGLGVVLLEALASGTPCIGSDVGGIPDVISPDVGFLFEPQNTDDLARCMINLTQDKNLWKSMIWHARKRAEQVFSWDKIGKSIVSEYSSILKSFNR